MNYDNPEKLIFSIIALFIITVLFQFIKYYTKKTQRKLNLKMNRYFAIRRFTSLFSILLFFWFSFGE